MRVPKKMMMQQGAGALPWYISLPGTGTAGIDALSEASLDDLAAAAFTAEAWFNQAVVQPDVTVTFMNKGNFATGGWLIYLNALNGINTNIDCVTTDSTSAWVGNIRDGLWHHLTVCYDNLGDRKTYIAIDGIWGQSSVIAGNGLVVTDASDKLKIGVRTDGPNWRYKGYFGWMRISNNIRYSVSSNFTPTARAYPPANDANTVRLFWVNEGTGTVLTDKSTNAQNASINTGTWGQG